MLGRVGRRRRLPVGGTQWALSSPPLHLGQGGGGGGGGGGGDDGEEGRGGVRRG